MQYPYFSPQILTDSVFLTYGGQTGTSTTAQRQASYLLAEMLMTENLSAFLLPTVITGSAFWRGGSLFETEYGYVQRVIKAYAEIVVRQDPLETEYHTGSALVRNWEQGLLDIFIPYNYGQQYGQAYKTFVVYESGFATGTVTQPDILSALTLAAQIQLNEWDASLSNEGVSDIGVERFSNQSYFEQRKFLVNTVFGNSAHAQRIKRLVNKYRTKPAIGFR